MRSASLRTLLLMLITPPLNLPLSLLLTGVLSLLKAKANGMPPFLRVAFSNYESSRHKDFSSKIYFPANHAMILYDTGCQWRTSTLLSILT
jgi:hypothetical protein